MTSRAFSFRLLSLSALAVATTVGVQAQDARSRTDTTKQPAATAATGSRAPTRGGSARGPLPDPILLDGSSLPVEKRAESGMIGDFELPGDDNAPRDAKVGGQQPPGSPQGGAQGGPQQMGIPQMGGGGGPQSPNQTPPAGGQSGGQPPSGQQQGAQNAAGGPIAGASDPNGKAEGTQVGQLQTDPNAGGDGQPMPNKPSAVSIGDSAMQIKGVPNAPGVVGTSAPAGQTQQMEKAVGGGRGSSSIPGSRGAAEKGATMPAGL